MCFVDVKVLAQVESGFLFHFCAIPNGLDDTKGVIRYTLFGIFDFCLTNIHPINLTYFIKKINNKIYFMALHSGLKG
jgi:hypothetical protein